MSDDQNATVDASPLASGALANVQPPLAWSDPSATADKTVDFQRASAPADVGAALNRVRAGRYVLESQIGCGGMGVVWRARDPDLDRPLAIKLMLPRSADDATARERFLKEARLTGQLQHPGVPPVHELGRLDDGRPFFAMKLIEGRTFAELLADPNAPAARALDIFAQVCQTIAYAHSHGVIHRDLKPQNIMVGAFGEVQVMDWGLAKKIGREPTAELHTSSAASASLASIDQSLKDGDASGDPLAASATQAGDVLGTPAYLAPEQARGEIQLLDERCDVFGLGAILCVILTGKTPYDGATVKEVLVAAVHGQLTGSFRRLDTSGADPELIDLAKRCLAPRRDERPRHAGLVADALATHQARVQERLRNAELERAQAEVKATEEKRRRAVERQRGRLVLAVAGLAMVLVLGGAVGSWWFQLQQQEAVERRQRTVQTIDIKLQEAGAARARLHASLRNFDECAQLLREPARWQAQIAVARAAVDQASELQRDLAEAAPIELAGRIDAMRLALDADEADRLLAIALEQVPLDRTVTIDGEHNHTGAMQTYQTLLKPWEAPSANDRVDEVARRIKESPIQQQLLIAIIDWSMSAKELKNEELSARLTQLASKVDPHAWRVQVRDPARWTRPTELLRFAKFASAGDLTPESSYLIATLMQSHAPAENWLRDQQERKPQDFWLNFYLAMNLRDHKPADAVGFFRAALVVRPKSAPVAFNLGGALRVLKNYPQAIGAFRKVIELAPKNAPAYANLATLLQEQNDLDGAVEQFHKAIALDPNHAFIHYNLGNTFLRLNKFPEAAAAYETAFKLAPKPSFANNLGTAYARQDDFEKAVVMFRKACDLAPKDPSYRFNLGNAQLQHRQFAEAATTFRQAADLYGANHPLQATIQERLDECARRGVGSVAPKPTLVEPAAALERWRGNLVADDPLDDFETTKKSHRRVHQLWLSAGKAYQIDLRGGFDGFLRIEDAQRRPLLYNDDVSPPKGLDARLIFQPAQTSKYRLIVTSFKPAAVGAYDLHVREAKPIDAGGSIPGDLQKSESMSQGRFLDIQRVNLRADTAYTFELSSAAFDTYLMLLDPVTNKTLSVNDDITPGNKRLSRLDFTPRESGVYPIAVTSAQAGETGNYVLRVQGFRVTTGQE